MIENDGKRFRIEVEEWKPTYNDTNVPLKCKHMTFKCDTMEELKENMAVIEESYSNIKCPDKYNNKFINETDKMKKYTYTDDKFWWCAFVVDFKELNISDFIGNSKGTYEHQENPTENPRLYDIYFRTENDVPKDYSWDDGEYAGWLKFKWEKKAKKNKNLKIL
jgi:hypothetical protein